MEELREISGDLAGSGGSRAFIDGGQTLVLSLGVHRCVLVVFRIFCSNVPHGQGRRKEPEKTAKAERGS